jgi:hypothetical protein
VVVSALRSAAANADLMRRTGAMAETHRRLAIFFGLISQEPAPRTRAAATPG